MSEHSDNERSLDAASESAVQDADSMRVRDRESATRDVSQEDVRNRAHEIYLRRGGADGDPVADWLEAEREVRGRSGAQQARDDRSETDQRL